MGSVAMPAAVGNAVRYGAHVPHSHHFSSLFFMLLGVVVIVLSLALLIIVSKWRIFEKAKQPGWATLVPVYGSVKLLEITSRPLWWVVLLFIPLVNLVVGITLVYRLARNFGKNGWFALGLVCLPFIFYPMLAFGKAEYKNTFPKPSPMSEAVKWTLIGLLAWAIVFGMMLAMGAGSGRPVRLQVLSDAYATDGTYVYMYDHPIFDADPATFEILGSDGGDYAKDWGHVYYDGTVLTSVQYPESFRLLDSIYARDDTQVYHDGEVVSCDANSFRVLSPESGYAEDAGSVYYEGAPVVGADRATFVVKNGDLSPYVSYDAKDAKHYYEGGELVK